MKHKIIKLASVVLTCTIFLELVIKMTQNNKKEGASNEE